MTGKHSLVMLILTLFLLTPLAGWAQPEAANPPGEPAAPLDVPTLIRHLTAPEAVLRAQAIEALAQAGRPALEPLLAAAKDDRPEVRGATALALARLQLGERVDNLPSPKQVDAVCNLLKDPDVQVRWQAVAALRETNSAFWITGGNMLAEVLALLKDPKPSIRAEVVCLLGDLQAAINFERNTPWLSVENINFDEVIIFDTFIANMLKDEDHSVRAAAVDALLELGPRAGTAVIPLLKAPAVTTRRTAASLLCRLHDPQTVPALVLALADPDAFVGDAAEQALARIGTPAIAPLIDALQSTDIPTRRHAASALARMIKPPPTGPVAGPADREGLRKAAEPLLGLLKDGDLSVRLAAIAALGAVKDARVTPALLALLHDAEPRVCVAAVDALENIGDRAVVEPLLAQLADDNATVLRYSLIVALGHLQDQRAVDPLLKLLPTEKNYRQAITTALVEIGDVKALPALLDFMADTHSYLYMDFDPHRFGADAVEPLLAVLPKKDHSLRNMAIRVLRELADPRALAPLAALAKDAADPQHDSAIDALAAFGTGGMAVLLDILRTGNQDDRSSAGYALAKVGAPAVDALAPLLRDGDETVRVAAIDALARCRDPRSVPLLMPLLADPSPAISAHAGNALSAIDDPHARDALMAALGEDNPRVRAAAARLLAEMRCFCAVDPLLPLLKDGDEVVRNSVADALGQLGDRRAVLPLVESLNDQENIWAIRALGKLGDPRAIPALIAVLKRPDNQRSRREAVDTLRALTGQKLFTDDPKRWEQWYAGQ